MRTQLLISRGTAAERLLKELTLEEREVVRMGLRCGGEVKPVQVAEWLNMSVQYARKLLRIMADKGIVTHDENKKRIRVYRIVSDRYHSLF